MGGTSSQAQIDLSTSATKGEEPKHVDYLSDLILPGQLSMIVCPSIHPESADIAAPAKLALETQHMVLAAEVVGAPSGIRHEPHLPHACEV